MPTDKWEKAHRANIKKGVNDINRQLTKNANSIAQKIKNLQSKGAISAKKYGQQILRNQTLLKEISKEFYSLEGNLNKTLGGLTKSAWDLANKKNDVDLKSFNFANNLIKKEWQKNNVEAYNAFMKRNVGGMNLSERIHNITAQNKQLYLDYIGSGITEGKSAAEIARELNKINNDPANVNVIDKHGNPSKLGLTSKLLVPGAQGQGIYRSPLKNFLRVTRNETNVAYRTADFERRQELDFVVGIEVHLSNGHPRKDMCDFLVGKYPKDFKFQSFHVLCMCYSTSIMASLEEMNAYFKTGEMNAANEVKDMPKNANKWVRETGVKAQKFDFVKNDYRLNDLVNPKLTAIMDQAKANIPDFAAKSNALAKRTGVKVTDTNLKSDVSTIRKVNGEYGGDYSKVKDSIRNTFIAPASEHETLIAEIKKTFDVTGVKRQVSDMGYTGNLINVRFKDGLIGEIQINTKQMIYAKDTDAKYLLPKKDMDKIFKQTGLKSGMGHTYYEEFRILDAKGIGVTAQEANRMRELQALSTKYYNTIKESANPVIQTAEQRKLNKIINSAKAKNLSTEDLYSKNGIYTKERLLIHDKIIDDLLKEVSHTAEGKNYFLGGATANGKSTLVGSGRLPHPKGILTVDSDKIKSMIPEYKHMLATGDSTAANFVHEESSHLAKRLLSSIQESGKDFVLDGVNDGDFEKLLKKIKGYKATGAKLRADYVSLDSNLSIDLARARAVKTGREVPLKYIQDTNKEISRLIPKLIEKNAFDELYLWDTNINKQPRLILTQIKGKLKIYDKKLYSDFLAKGK